MKKADYEKKIEEQRVFLKEVLEALNQIKNTKVSTKNFTSTYDICSKIGKFVNQ